MAQSRKAVYLSKRREVSMAASPLKTSPKTGTEIKTVAGIVDRIALALESVQTAAESGNDLKPYLSGIKRDLIQVTARIEKLGG